MKKITCVILFAFFAAQMFAQQWSDKDETLFNRSHRGGFFVGPIIEYSDFDNDITTSVGGGLGFIAGDFFFGLYGLGVADYDRLLNDDFESLDMGHGGFWLGFNYPQNKAIHLFTSVKAGWGGLDVQFDDFDYEDAFFTVTPEAGLELNVFSWLRIGASVGYRFMNGLDETPQFDTKDLETMTGSLTFRLGGFGKARNKWSD